MTTLTSALAISYINLASGRTITATSSATGFPASNLSTPRLGQRWHSETGAPAIASQDLIVDLGSIQQFDIVAELGTNLEDDATRTHFGDDVAGFASVDWNPGIGNAFDVTLPPLIPGRSGWPAFGRHVIEFTQTTQSDRYVLSRLSDSGNADNYLRVSVIWVGLIEQFAFDFQWEPGPWKVDGEPGSQRVYRLHNFTFKGVTLHQKIKLESLYYYLHETGRMLVVPRPKSPETWISEAIYCTFQGPPRPIRMLTDPEAWTVQVTFVEVID